MDLKYDNLMFELRVLAAFAQSCEIKISGGRRASCQRKQKKSIDQRAPVTRYRQVKELRAINIKLLENFYHSLNDVRNQNIPPHRTYYEISIPVVLEKLWNNRYNCHCNRFEQDFKAN